MQMNNVLKGFMLTMSVMTIAACSVYKTANNEDISNMDTGAANMDIAMSSNHGSSNAEIPLKMQELQRNNVVYCDLDKYDIRPEFTQMLDAHANFLRGNPSYTVTVEGHADERGTPEYNIALGEHRANAVKMYLRGKGVSADQIAIVSYGKEKPAILGHDELAYAKNRRAVLVY